MRWLLGSAGFIATVASGCALCCSPHDFDYAAYGTRVSRVDQQHSRVGSVFSDSTIAPMGSEVLVEDAEWVEGYPESIGNHSVEEIQDLGPTAARGGVYLDEPDMLRWEE